MPDPPREALDNAAEVVREYLMMASRSGIGPDEVDVRDALVRALPLLRVASAASSPPTRVEWRVIELPALGGYAVMASGEALSEAEAWSRWRRFATASPGRRFVVQRSECGPWVDVPDEGADRRCKPCRGTGLVIYRPAERLHDDDVAGRTCSWCVGTGKRRRSPLPDEGGGA